MDTADTLLRNQINTLLFKVKQLLILQKLFDAVIDKNLQPYIKVAAYENNCLTLIVENASISTRLRFIEPDIITNLKKSLELQALESIKCKVRPENQKSDIENKTERKISKESAELIKQTAEHIKDENIKAALKHLIS